MSTPSRPYQGYPYVNPVVIDVPSLDAATAAKWTNLPRRQLGVASNSHPQQPKRPGTSQQGPETGQERPDTSQGGEINEAEDADHLGAESTRSDRETEEDNPVVYIEIPDNNASCVVESPRSEHAHERSENAEAAGTIFYDPFKDRTIELRASVEDSDDEEVASSPPTRVRPYPHRPPPPTTLQVPSQGGTASNTSSNLGTSGIPAFTSKEAGYYGRLPTPDDGFLLAPIPVTDFPEPPPAYSEVDRVPTRPTIDQATTPPRTEVVTTVTEPTSTIRPGSDRKLLQCQHCGQRVHSLVVRESGAFTHVLALIVAFLCLIPIVIIIYCTDSCKYKNHYCPNCNQLIGYEIPILCQQIAFV